MVSFAHAYETLLDHVRDGRVRLSAATIALCIRANDIVADFVNAAKTGAKLMAQGSNARTHRGQGRVFLERVPYVVDQALWIWIVHDLNPRAMSPKVKGFVQSQSWFQDLTPISMQ